MNIGPIRKAVVASAVAGTGALAAAAIDNSITFAEWSMVAASAVAALGAVYRVENKES